MHFNVTALPQAFFVIKNSEKSHNPPRVLYVNCWVLTTENGADTTAYR
jgi:hypothetical protein